MSKQQLGIQQRFTIGIIFCGFFFVLILGKMFYLQTFRYKYLYEQSESNRIRVQPVAPKRGNIYDRDMNVLADNRAAYTLAVVPVETRKTETLDNIANLLNLPVDEIDRRVKKNMISRHQPAIVKRDIPFNMVAILEEQNEEYPGAVYHKDQARRYVPDLAGECFTGYVGEVSVEERKTMDPAIYRSGTMIGKAGIEKYYDDRLRGIDGTEYLEIAATGQILGVLEDQPNVPAENGSDLVLTIDSDIQKAAYGAFGDFCCGAAVAIDPRSGEVLALVSKPSNDANIFSTVMTDSVWKSIVNDTTNPLLNRPLDGLYPPGSTYKLVIAGAGLELGLIDNETVFPSACNGWFRFGIRNFGCWDKRGHGRLPVKDAIEQSCDVFFYQLGLKLGLEEFHHYSTACGFGKKTGIDLPQEMSGNVPDKRWYDRRIGENKWTKAVLLNLGIGQGEILTTPLQLAQFYCGLANGGRVYRPHLLKAVIGPDGRQTIHGGEFSFSLPFSQNTLEILNAGLVSVVQGEHGTARGSRIKGVTIAGKTGTAENPHGEDHSWFVGFAPVENPQIVAAVIIENAGHGSEFAAPAVRKILKAYIDKYLPDTTAVAIMDAN